MNAKELQIENERLKELLSKAECEREAQRQQLAQTQAQHAAVAEQFSQTLADKDQQVASLKHQIKLLLQRIKGSRQERINPEQLMLFSLEELQAIADELEQSDDEVHPGDDGSCDSNEDDKKGKAGRSRRKMLPKNLRREIVRHELTPEERACPCCGEQRQEMGFVPSEQLEHVPAQWKVIEHQRVKYTCRICTENVAIADKPPQPIEKGLPGPGLCAHTVLSKFGDHQPLYRQEDIHSRTGLMIRRSTMCGWLQALAVLSRPLVMRMKYLLLQSKVVHTDDTSIKMLQPGTGIALTAKFWPYLGDWLHPYAVYDFTINRERDGPQKFLDGYMGYLQADAYAGYDCVYASQQVHEVACWIHARRHWHEARDNDVGRANMALGFIARLSQIENREAIGRSLSA